MPVVPLGTRFLVALFSINIFAYKWNEGFYRGLQMNVYGLDDFEK